MRNVGRRTQAHFRNYAPQKKKTSARVENKNRAREFHNVCGEHNAWGR